MRKILTKHWYPLLFSLILTGGNSYALLKTFVIPNAQVLVAEAESQQTTTVASNELEQTSQVSSASSSQAIITDKSYQDDNIQINIDTLQVADTSVYVADIQLKSADYLKTALAQQTFGTNITATTSSIADSVGAILAVNGDFYGANNEGYVIKNGVLYRDSQRESQASDLIIYEDGTFAIIDESQVSATSLIEQGTYNSFAFGPSLIEEGQITVSENDEVNQSMTSNPRTAIGFIDDLHYIMLVSDGRTEESAGLSLYQVAQVMADYGVTTAYNLDGGGSSTMYFMGQVINKPTTNGKIKERSVSDIVYIGY